MAGETMTPWWDNIGDWFNGLGSTLDGVSNVINSSKNPGSNQPGGTSQPLLPEKKQNNTTLWLVGIGGVVLIGTLLVVFLRKKPA